MATLREIGVDPVVYYSTVPGLTLTDETANLNNAAVWSTAAPADLSTVTAIAVDAGKDTDGNDYILTPDVNLIVYVHMRAPYEDEPFTIFSIRNHEDDPNDHNNNAHAYNSARMDAKVYRDAGVEDDQVVYFTYTKVGILPHEVTVEKVWNDMDDNDRKRPGSVTVHLFADGVDLDRSAELSDENDWKYTFKHLPKYDETGRAIVYSFVEDEVPYYMVDYSPNGDTITVTNVHVPEKVNIHVEKEWVDDRLPDGSFARPATITVRLLADGEFTGQSKTIRADADGNWSADFTNLLKYNAGVEIEYTVEEETIYDFKPPVYTRTEDGWLITNPYYPYGDLSVTKNVENVTEASRDQAFSYTLLLTDEVGEDLQDAYAYTIVTAEGGTIFSGNIRNGGRFQLHAGETIHIKDIPSRAQYEIIEDSEKGWTLITSSNVTGTIVSGTEKQASFTNSYTTAGTATLKAHKTLTGHDLARYQFRFEVTSEDDPDTAIKLASNKADGSVSFSDLNYSNADDGKTFTYYISEIVQDKAGYVYDRRVYKATVTTRDNGDGSMTCPVVYSYGDETVELPEFVNEYHAEGDLTLRAWKLLEGRSLTDGEFSFVLLDENGRELGTARNNADGGVAFPALHYTEADVGKTYYYFARELRGDDPTVIYTEGVCGYYVTVIDNDDGTLSFDQGFVDASNRYLPCTDCAGIGYDLCEECNGTGKVGDEDCTACEGKGHTETPCETCSGLGLVWNPDWEPQVVTDLPMFVNRLEDGSLSITKLVEDAPEDDNTEFTFKIVLTGDKITDGDWSYTLTQAGAGSSGVNPHAITHSRNSHYAPLLHRQIRRMGLDENGIFHATEAELVGTAYAVLTDDGELIFFRSEATYTEDSTGPFTDIDGNTYTGKLCPGFETREGPYDNNHSWSCQPWYSDNLKTVRMAQAIKPITTSHWFENCSHLITISLDKLDTSLVENMSMMFYLGHGSSAAESITGLSSWDVSHVTNMRAMFLCASKVTSLDVADWDVSHVTDMGSMFSYCRSLSELDLSKWNTSSAVNMSGMFQYCEALEALDVSRFVTTNVTSFESMFDGCNSVVNLDVSKWKTANATSMSRMFSYCNSLENLDVSEWKMSKVTSMGNMFDGCSSLTSLDVSKWDTSAVEYMYYMFNGCSSLTGIDCSKWNTSSVVNTGVMFNGCSGLTQLDCSSWNTSAVHNMQSMFANCANLQSLDISSFDLTRLSQNGPLDSMFEGDANLSCVKLGEKFKFKSEYFSYSLGHTEYTSAILPTPPTTGGYTGLWVREGTDDARTAEDLRDTYNGATDAGTWVWQIVGYTVQYEAPEGVGGSMANAVYPVDSAATLTNKFVLFDHKFTGFQVTAINGEAVENGAIYESEDGSTATIPADTYALDQVITLTPLFERLEHSASMEDGEIVITLHGGETATFEDIPAGTAYQVYEQTPDGWTLIAQEKVSGLIEPLVTAEAKFTNKFTPGVTTAQLYGFKTLDNQPAKDREFMFYLYELRDGNYEQISSTYTQDGGMFIFPAIEYTTADPNAIGTHKYKIIESTYYYQGSGGGSSRIEYDKHEEFVTVEVTKDEEGLHAVVTYDDDGARFSNVTRPGHFSVTKQTDGLLTEANADAEFEVEITLTNENGMPLGNGEEIYWYIRDAEGNIVTNSSGSHPAPYTTGRGLRSRYAPLTHIRRLDPASTPFHATEAQLQGMAYAVLTGEGDLIFFRSRNTYTEASTGPFVDILNNSYEGTLYTGFETATYNWDAPWRNNASIKRVLIAEGQAIKPVSTAFWFCEMDNLTSCDLTRLDTSDVTNMGMMFRFLPNLTSLDLSGFDTSNVTTMWAMFLGCSALTSLDVSGFDTSKVTEMDSMFFVCSGLTSLDVSGFDTSNVTTMYEMFYGCGLTSVDLSGWNTSNVWSMYGMFSGCGNLTSIDLSHLNMSNVTTMERMFANCGKLTNVNLSGVNMSSLANMSYMFEHSGSLISVDLSGMNAPNVTTMREMFYDCRALTSVDMSNMDLSSVSDMLEMFQYCRSLTSVDFSGIKTSKVSTMYFMFASCSSLESIDLSGFDTSGAENATTYAMFSGCSSLASVNMNGFDTSKVTQMYAMFGWCRSLTSLDLGDWDTSNVTDMAEMFEGCKCLESLDLSGWDTSNVTNMNGAFNDCSSLSRVKLGENFRFVGGCQLPTPPSTVVYSGKWALEEDERIAYTSEDLSEEYNGRPELVGTWVWQLSDAAIVRFDGNGGYCNAPMFGSRNPEDKVLMPTLAYASRLGYELVAWNTKKDGSGDSYEPGKEYAGVLQEHTVVTLYAQWESSPTYRYIVEYYQQSPYYSYGSGYQYSLVERIADRAESGTPLPAAETDKYDDFYYGYSNPETAVVEENDDNVIRHYYNRIRYTINFDGNGAEGGAMNSMTFIGGWATQLPDNGFYRKRWIFTGWNTEPDGSGKSYNDRQSAKNMAGNGETVTLYAQWVTNENSVQPTNGRFTAKLHAGETLVVPDLPAGTTYTVTEINVPDGWTQTGMINGEGRVYTGTTAEATIKNTYAAETKVVLQAHKTLIGDTLRSGQFEFTLSDAEGNVIDTKHNAAVDVAEEIAGEGEETQANPWYNTAPVLFDEIKYTEEGEFLYTIREVLRDDEHIYDEAIYTVKVEVKDLGNGKLEADVTYMDADGQELGHEPLFSNRMKPGALEVTKSVKNATEQAANTQFTFTVELEDSAGNALSGSYPVTILENGEPVETAESITISSGGTVSIGGGQSFRVSSLPHGARYTVTEASAPGWKLTNYVNANGGIRAGETAKASFENTYSTKGSVELNAQKIFVGGEIGLEMFSFEVMDSEGRVLRRAYADPDGGSVAFDPIDYDQGDNGQTFTYYIREVIGSMDDVDYDDHVSIVDVTVTDNGQGKLVAEKQYRSEEEAEGARFTNTLYCGLVITKAVEGNMGELDRDFSFVIRLWTVEDETEVPYVISDEALASLEMEKTETAGEYAFTLRHGDRLELRLICGTHYTITESKGDDYTASILVTDDEGTVLLTADGVTGTYVLDENQTAAFTNTREVLVPTNADVKAVWVVTPVIALAGMALIVFALRRKKKEDEA